MDAAPRSKRHETEQRGCPLPEEIMEDILSRMPVKSLRRFQSVSPSWDALITSPAFESLHSERSRGGGSANRRLFLMPSWWRPFYAWNGKPGGAVETILDVRYLPDGIIFPITNSCHGLVLLRCLDFHLCYVWNPSACEILTLPDRTPSRLAWRGRSYVAYGMGYCSATERYKVVRMYNFDAGNGLQGTVCEVFTLDESTHWRLAATQPADCQIRIRGDQGAVLCNGNLHFIQKRGLDLVTTFNITDETFGTMILPPELKSHWFGFMLTELDGCLCAYHKEDPQKLDEPYHIWLLRDYGAGKWERLRCIDWGTMSKTESAQLQSSWIAPIGMYHGDSPQKKKKVMFGTGRCRVFVVDPDTGVPEILFSLEDTANGECLYSQFPTMGLFEESLVSVGPTSEDIIFSSPSAQAWSEVLTYLPARTVGRMNRVCKDWRAMIKAECFVDAHLCRANLDRRPRIMFTNGERHMFKALEHFINSSNEPPLIDDGSTVVCSKPCYGLNAGSMSKNDFVCNPLTYYYKRVPLDDGTEDYYQSSNTPSADVVFAGRLGLGYDTVIGKHVLVRLVYKEEDLRTRDYKLECKIRLVEQRCWHDVQPPPRPVANVPPACAEGRLYWMVDPELGPRSRGCEIIVFDWSTREFEVIEGPLCSHGSGRMSIHELQGEVCVVSSARSTNTVEIWAMDSNNRMWSMQQCIELARFSSEYSAEEATPLAIDPRDGRILLSTGKALGFYDPKILELETIYRLVAHIQGKKFVPILFMDSLVEPCDAVS